ncbi:hypothetical protein LDENG_00291460 [Lucifuga dentata]|nr:hypothetical protein LDENG_00291460 [Lucifuga dentata]
MESVITSSISVWFGSATSQSEHRLQRIMWCAERIIGCPLLSITNLHSARSKKRARKITADPSHPGHALFQHLPSLRNQRLRALKTRTTRLLHSFFLQAITLINFHKLS